MVKIDFSAVVRQWLESPEDDRDLAHGALMVLQMTANQQLYRVLTSDLQRNARRIESELRALLEQRSELHTEEEKQEARREAQAAVDETVKVKSAVAGFKAGMRADHDSLPKDIKDLYEQNMESRRKMRMWHLEIQQLMTSGKNCATDDLRTLAKMLRAEDVKVHDRWKIYDSYGRSK